MERLARQAVGSARLGIRAGAGGMSGATPARWSAGRVTGSSWHGTDARLGVRAEAAVDYGGHVRKAVGVHVVLGGLLGERVVECVVEGGGGGALTVVTVVLGKSVLMVNVGLGVFED